jgi:hypothetical protein
VSRVKKLSFWGACASVDFLFLNGPQKQTGVCLSERLDAHSVGFLFIYFSLARRLQQGREKQATIPNLVNPSKISFKKEASTDWLDEIVLELVVFC